MCGIEREHREPGTAIVPPLQGFGRFGDATQGCALGWWITLLRSCFVWTVAYRRFAAYQPLGLVPFDLLREWLTGNKLTRYNSR